MKKPNNRRDNRNSVNSTFRFCRGCKKVLPEGYEGKLCEACKNKRADMVKKGLNVAKGALAVAAMVTPLGKYIPRKK